MNTFYQNITLFSCRNDEMLNGDKGNDTKCMDNDTKFKGNDIKSMDNDTMFRDNDTMSKGNETMSKDNDTKPGAITQRSGAMTQSPIKIAKCGLTKLRNENNCELRIEQNCEIKSAIDNPKFEMLNNNSDKQDYYSVKFINYSEKLNCNSDKLNNNSEEFINNSEMLDNNSEFFTCNYILTRNNPVFNFQIRNSRKFFGIISDKSNI